MRIGLRVDVDTFSGTKYGVPGLCELLADHSIKASFFYSVGPDNMGRHLWRLVRPTFLLKVLRTKAANLYGWDILLKGTFWPGPVIGAKLGGVIRAASDGGHETGLHAWDHQAWQARIESMDANHIRNHLRRGADTLESIIGRQPTCSAAPAWKCNDAVLTVKEEFPFAYNSDCRGQSIFRPAVGGKELKQPQVPSTLPTYDEVVGRNGVDAGNYNDYMLSLLQPDKLNVLTIHAEAEGRSCRGMFDSFIKRAKAMGAEFTTLGSLVADAPQIGSSPIVQREFPGREGWLACQHATGSNNTL